MQFVGMREQAVLGFLGFDRTAGRALRIIACILQLKRPRGNPKKTKPLFGTRVPQRKLCRRHAFGVASRVQVDV